MNSIGERIKQVRKQFGLSQEELGDKLNVTRQTVSKWELNQTIPDINKLKEASLSELEQFLPKDVALSLYNKLAKLNSSFAGSDDTTLSSPFSSHEKVNKSSTEDFVTSQE